jgi:hypothetical protein
MTEFERKAQEDYDCPLSDCKRGGGTKGHPCVKLSSTNNYWDVHNRAHPHPERVALARRDTVDQGAVNLRHP